MLLSPPPPSPGLNGNPIGGGLKTLPTPILVGGGSPQSSTKRAGPLPACLPGGCLVGCCWYSIPVGRDYPTSNPSFGRGRNDGLDDALLGVCKDVTSHFEELRSLQTTFECFSMLPPHISVGFIDGDISRDSAVSQYLSQHPNESCLKRSKYICKCFDAFSPLPYQEGCCNKIAS